MAASSTNFSLDNNLTEYTESERLIKSSVELIVPGYILNAKQPGLPNQIRSTFSAPFVEFGYFDANSQVIIDINEKSPESEIPLTDNIKDLNSSKFILSDTLTSDDINNKLERGKSSEKVQKVIQNPFTNEKETQYSKVLTRNNRSGETVASSLIIKKIETQFN